MLPIALRMYGRTAASAAKTTSNLLHGSDSLILNSSNLSRDYTFKSVMARCSRVYKLADRRRCSGSDLKADFDDGMFEIFLFEILIIRTKWVFVGFG